MDGAADQRNDDIAYGGEDKQVGVGDEYEGHQSKNVHGEINQDEIWDKRDQSVEVDIEPEARACEVGGAVYDEVLREPNGHANGKHI